MPPRPPQRRPISPQRPAQPAAPRVRRRRPGSPAANEAGDPPPAFGVDIGGAASFDGLRALWNSTRKTHAALLEGLHPVVIVRENTRTRAAELRLIVGPLPDPESAAQFCATLAAAKRSCQPATFEGPELSLAAPDPPRRPAAAPERKAAPRPPVRPNPVSGDCSA